MIVLDTNVISALMRREPEEVVVSWLDAQPPESVWTTSVTVFEVCFGLELLATGKRRRRLEDAIVASLAEDFDDRIAVFDPAAAREAARLAAMARQAGRPVEIREVQLAGIVSARRATLATCNTRHFDHLDLDLVNPWADGTRP